MLTKVPIFQHLPTVLIKLLANFLIPEIYLPGDHVILKGDVGNEMFFIIEGGVDILTPDDT